ncbi:creatininase family protein [Salinarchaeum chitinilyticum]
MYRELGASSDSWAGKSYPEIVELAEQPGSVLVIPVGSVEQHGHHLPVATDTILVDAVAHEGARRVREDVPILLTPPVWSGFSPHHMAFGGTMSLSHRTLLTVLEEVADTALENGFDAVLFLNGHGGNTAVIGSVVNTLGNQRPGNEVLGLTYFELAEPFVDEVRDSDTGGMAHGGEFETSLMAHLRPDLVGDGEAIYWEDPYDLAGDDLLEGGPLSVHRPFTAYSDTGAIGDLDLASSEKGEELYDLLGAELASLFRAINEQNR